MADGFKSARWKNGKNPNVSRKYNSKVDRMTKSLAKTCWKVMPASIIICISDVAAASMFPCRVTMQLYYITWMSLALTGEPLASFNI